MTPVAEKPWFRRALSKQLVEFSGGATLLVSEIFGPTIQGEGPNAGRRAVFLRLGGCNLTCHGCDTPYTWRWSENLPHNKPEVYDPKKELQRISFEEIALQINQRIGNRPDTLLVITGGEPMLQAARLTNFLGYLCRRGGGLEQVHIEVETNGTRLPSRGLLALVNQWNVSPKLSHWGNNPEDSFKPEILNEFLQSKRAVFKFVCQSGDDVHEAAALAAEADIPASRVWIMPEGITPLELMVRSLAVCDATLLHGFQFTLRSHIFLFGGDHRGT